MADKKMGAHESAQSKTNGSDFPIVFAGAAMSVDQVLARLDGVQGKGPRWRAICPAHESKHASRTLSIFEPEPGRVLIHCFAGCDAGSVVGAVGLDLSDLFPPREHGRESRPAIRKPWRVSDVVAALRGDLAIVAQIVAELSPSLPERERGLALAALDRIGDFLGELDHAS